MKFCDVTMAYNHASGGIRTYIDEKRRYLRDCTEHEHLLIIPGARNRVRRSGRSVTITIAGPLLPGQSAYRAFLSPLGVGKALEAEAPDIVEIGSYYAEAWAAMAYRRRSAVPGRETLLGGYFHTDVPKAYVSEPLHALSQAWFEDVSPTLAGAAEKLADIATASAEKYMRRIFSACDLVFASSEAQAARVLEYGVEDVCVAPMGVDTRLFAPARRSRALRERHGARDEDFVLVFAGRLCEEKRIGVLIKAFERLPEALNARLWLVGDGPLRAEAEAAALRNPRLAILDYEQDRAAFATLLASADCYVTAGPFETFGLSVLEAQACGLAVVGVDAGALRERVPPELGFLGPADDDARLAENIVRAATSHRAIGRRARAHVDHGFRWSDALRRLIGVYEAKAVEAGIFAAPRRGALGPAEHRPPMV